MDYLNEEGFFLRSEATWVVPLVLFQVVHLAKIITVCWVATSGHALYLCTHPMPITLMPIWSLLKCYLSPFLITLFKIASPTHPLLAFLIDLTIQELSSLISGHIPHPHSSLQTAWSSQSLLTLLMTLEFVHSGMTSPSPCLPGSF